MESELMRLMALLDHDCRRSNQTMKRRKSYVDSNEQFWICFQKRNRSTHCLDSEFTTSNCVARNNFHLWDDKKLPGSNTFLGVASTHRASKSEARNSQFILRSTCVFGPRTDIGRGQGALGVLIPGAPICSHGTETDYNNRFYWVNFIQLYYFEIKEEKKRPHNHCQKQLQRGSDSSVWVSGEMPVRPIAKSEHGREMSPGRAGDECLLWQWFWGVRRHYCEYRAVGKDSVKWVLGEGESLCPCVKILELHVEVYVLYSKSPK